MSTPEQRIRDFYGFDFPDDFFRFREFLGELPLMLLGEALDMWPAHPFKVAAGEPARSHPEHPQWQDRYFDDLPEFLTLFGGTIHGLHWGYFSDDPGKQEPLVVHYHHKDSFAHSIDGGNIFAAVRHKIEKSEGATREEMEILNEEQVGLEQLGQLAAIRDVLSRYWGSDRPETGDDYDGDPVARHPVAETSSGMGVVAARLQYEALSSDPFVVHNFRSQEPKPDGAEIQRLTAEAFDMLGRGLPVAALQLGHNLWCWADGFPQAYALLDAAYEALGRTPLRKWLGEAKAYRAWCDEKRK